MFTTFTVDNKDYNLKLTAKACVELERKLGTNPLNVLGRLANADELPTLETLLTILHCSLVPMNHGITIDDTYSIYDKYVEEGHTMLDLIPVIIDVFKSSGFIKEPTEKNEKTNG